VKVQMLTLIDDPEEVQIGWFAFLYKVKDQGIIKAYTESVTGLTLARELPRMSWRWAGGTTDAAGHDCRGVRPCAAQPRFVAPRVPPRASQIARAVIPPSLTQPHEKPVREEDPFWEPMYGKPQQRIVPTVE